LLSPCIASTQLKHVSKCYRHALHVQRTPGSVFQDGRTANSFFRHGVKNNLGNKGNVFPLFHTQEPLGIQSLLSSGVVPPGRTIHTARDTIVWRCEAVITKPHGARINHHQWKLTNQHCIHTNRSQAPPEYGLVSTQRQVSALLRSSPSRCEADTRPTCTTNSLSVASPRNPQPLQVLLTLFAEFFALFDRSTCALTVSCRYLSLL